MTRAHFEDFKKAVLQTVAVATIAVGVGMAVPAQAQNAVTLTASDSGLSQWAHLVQVAGLTQAAQSNNVTVFAITNEGFNSVNKVYSNALMSPGAMGSPNFMRIQLLVMSQAVFGLHPMSEFAGKKVTLTSVAGTPLVVDGTTPGKITVEAEFTTLSNTGDPLTSSQATIYPMSFVKVNQ